MTIKMLSSHSAKVIYGIMARTGRTDPEALMQELGLELTKDTGVIERAVAEVIATNPDSVVQYRNGKISLLNFFVGQVLKQIKGADPKLANQLVQKGLKESY